MTATPWQSTDITVESANPQYPSGRYLVSILLGNISTVALEVAAAAQAMDPPNMTLSDLCTATSNACVACEGHDAAPPSGPPATWPNCQTAAAHEAYVKLAWESSCGVTNTGDVDWFSVKDAMDHGGMGGDEPDFG